MTDTLPQAPEKAKGRSKSNPNYPRTFAQMVDGMKEPVHVMQYELQMFYRTIQHRRDHPSQLTMEEIERVAEWLNEPFDSILEELQQHVATDEDVFSRIKRHPKGIDRHNPKSPTAKPVPKRDE